MEVHIGRDVGTHHEAVSKNKESLQVIVSISAILHIGRVPNFKHVIEKTSGIQIFWDGTVTTSLITTTRRHARSVVVFILAISQR